MELVHSILNHVPEVAIFLSLALGYAIGAIKFGSFQLGGVGGSLLVAVVVSQIGISVDAGVKSIMFALFIYAVGYESGPQFFSSLSRKTLREIAMAMFLAASGLVTVLICAKLFGFDKGLAAGVAGGDLRNRPSSARRAMPSRASACRSTKSSGCSRRWPSATP